MKNKTKATDQKEAITEAGDVSRKERLRLGYRKTERAVLTHIYRFLIIRWRDLAQVRLRVAGWLALVGCLLLLTVVQNMVEDQVFTRDAGVAGGLYSEGIVGEINDINPIFATTSEEKALSRLAYSGLLDYDEANRPTPRLLEKYTVAADGKSYNFTLKEGLVWSDGSPLTVDDVLFTINTIKDPKAKSSYYKNFSRLTIEKTGERTFQIKTSLPTDTLLNCLTVGILPASQYQGVAPEAVREAFHSKTPISSGPYKYIGNTSDESGEIFNFTANGNYILGRAQIPAVQVRAYDSSGALREAVMSSDINAAVGLTRLDAETATHSSVLNLTQPILQEGVMALFNTTSPLLGEQAVREALRLAVNRDEIRQSLTTEGLTPPALEGPTYGEFISKQPAWDVAAAKSKLDAAGWRLIDGVRTNGEGKKLQISLVTLSGADYTGVAEHLATDWRNVGVTVDVQYVDAKQLQSNYLIPRNYDVLLTQLQFDANDDFSAYWHSSNANPSGTNYSNYSSSIVDLAINNAQIAKTEDERQTRYETIVKQWVADAPAIALYSPRLYYIANNNITSLRTDEVLIDTDWRFSGVVDWTALRQKVYSTL